ncbi:MAG TPA: tetratricopeptide repeat protein [Gemmataceae bacterium]|nr:tetratricopeptide repeat protein [Gemmataceae bacterium]
MFSAPSTGDERPAGPAIADSQAGESAVAWAARSTSKSPSIRVWSGAVWKLLRRRRFVVGCLLLFLLAACAVVIGPHLRAWYHFRAARRELDRYHNPQAIRHLQACLEQWPKDADAILLAARAARRAGRYTEADSLVEKYQQARGLDDAGSFEQLLLSVERRVDQSADACWRHVEQGHPDAPLILEALTRGYLRQYRLAEARACLNRWLQSEPDNAQACYLEGLFHLDYAHARGAATTSYRRAVELDPEHEEARLGLAVTLLDAHDFAEAAEHLEYVRQHQPGNLSVRVGLAECRDALEHPEEAERLVNGVLAEQPDFAPALALRGRILFDSGRAEVAEDWLRRAVARDPSNHRARFNLAACLRQIGKTDEAGQQQQLLEQLEGDLARFDEIVTKEMLQRPRDPALHAALGRLLLRGGRREEGLRWLHSALRLDPQNAAARETLAEFSRKEAVATPPEPN